LDAVSEENRREPAIVISKTLFWKVVRYGIVGVVVALTFAALNWLFGHWLGKWQSYLIAYPPALVIHFFLNRKWTFGYAGRDLSRQVFEYAVMAAATFAIQSGVFAIMVAKTQLPGWFDALAANAAQVIVTFLVMHFRIFRHPSPAK
jgi:putative flippase GtrA